MSEAEEYLKDKWAGILDLRLSCYFKLYQSFLNFETFFLVAHRNFVSSFDLSNAEWRHYEYDDCVRHLGLAIRYTSE